METRELARRDWKAGMKYKDIAVKHGVPESTVKSWAARYWRHEKDATRPATKSKKVATQKLQPSQPPVAPKTIEQQLAAAVEENDELTPQQKDFCLYYSRIKNATQAYLKAYGCSYNTAMVEGSRTLIKPKIQAELIRLRDIKAAAIGVDDDDIVELHARIAFADITDFAQVQGSTVLVKDSDQFDGQLISEVSEGPHGPKIKLADRHKSLAFLEGYLNLGQTERHTSEGRKKDIQTLADLMRNPVPNRELPTDE